MIIVGCGDVKRTLMSRDDTRLLGDNMEIISFDSSLQFSSRPWRRCRSFKSSQPYDETMYSIDVLSLPCLYLYAQN